jgi:tRNA G18 (ribose-2'-O)-methylase SpoU
LEGAAQGGGDGLFLAEGELVVRTLLGSSYETASVLVREAYLAKLAPDLDRLPPHTPVFTASQQTLDEIVGFHIHRGMLACGVRPREMPTAPIIERARTLVVLEDLSNHDNVGAIFRNVGCLSPVVDVGGAGAAIERGGMGASLEGNVGGGVGGAGVLLSARCCDPLYRKSLRVSMGHVLRVPFGVMGAWDREMGALRSAGFTTVALTPGGGEKAGGGEVIDLARVRWPERVALLLGAEGPGLTARAMNDADLRVRIPMAPGADSLNVATTAAVVLAQMGLVT